MSNYNPDAPVDNTGGFLQHTYQAQNNDMIYWNGNSMMGLNPNVGYNDGSRRNIMNPVNPMGAPVNPFSQFGQAQPQAIPESAVQPFSSYPPSSPSTAPQNLGLNSMVESRRNTPPTQPTVQNNPWAPQPQVPQYPVQPLCQPINGYFDPNVTPGYRVDMNTMALYGNGQFGFDKHNSWENYYTQNRTLAMPSINWNQPVQSMVPQGYAAYSQPVVQYPVNQFQPVNQSWKDIAEKNWAGQNI